MRPTAESLALSRAPKPMTNAKNPHAQSDADANDHRVRSLGLFNFPPPELGEEQETHEPTLHKHEHTLETRCPQITCKASLGYVEADVSTAGAFSRVRSIVAGLRFSRMALRSPH